MPLTTFSRLASETLPADLPPVLSSHKHHNTTIIFPIQLVPGVTNLFEPARNPLIDLTYYTCYHGEKAGWLNFPIQVNRMRCQY